MGKKKKKSLGTKLFFRRFIGSAVYFAKEISSEVQLYSQSLVQNKPMISPGLQNDEIEFGEDPEN